MTVRRQSATSAGSWLRRREAEFTGEWFPKAGGDRVGGTDQDLSTPNDEICRACAQHRERRLSAIRPVVRRGLSRQEAAMYIGVGLTKFDTMVASSVMPKPKRIDGRRVWDIVALDFAFDVAR